METRGRPRKAAKELLIERITVRMTSADRQMLEEICAHKQYAPEAFVRSLVVPRIREIHHKMFNENTSELTA